MTALRLSFVPFIPEVSGNPDIRTSDTLEMTFLFKIFYLVPVLPLLE